MEEKNVVKQKTTNKEEERLLLQTVARGATELEFKMFLEFCRSTGLNPFKREIWFIKNGNSVQIMTGINGFLAIANRHPEYDGMQVDIQEEDGKLISATASVYRKDRKHPSTAKVFFNEYAKNSPIWKSMPKMMLQKVAKSVALREAFPQELGGIYTQEEMPEEYSLKQTKIYHYDISKYAEPEKVPEILNYFYEKGGCTIDGSIVITNEKIEKLKSCLIKEE